MAAVKELVFEAMDLAAALELQDNDRPTALKAWTDFRLAMTDRYGEDINAMLIDIYDSIADRSGDYWELYQESN
jgi:hypothetical protein